MYTILQLLQNCSGLCKWWLCSLYSDVRQMGQCKQVGHLTNVLLNLLEIHEIGSVNTSESKQQNYDQIWHLWAPYQKLLGLSHFSWLSHSPVVDCTGYPPSVLYSGNSEFLFLDANCYINWEMVNSVPDFIHVYSHFFTICHLGRDYKK